jgi:hypothetical protein
MNHKKRVLFGLLAVGLGACSESAPSPPPSQAPGGEGGTPPARTFIQAPLSEFQPGNAIPDPWFATLGSLTLGGWDVVDSTKAKALTLSEGPFGIGMPALSVDGTVTAVSVSTLFLPSRGASTASVWVSAVDTSGEPTTLGSADIQIANVYDGKGVRLARTDESRERGRFTWTRFTAAIEPGTLSGIVTMNLSAPKGSRVLFCDPEVGLFGLPNARLREGERSTLATRDVDRARRRLQALSERSEARPTMQTPFPARQP